MLNCSIRQITYQCGENKIRLLFYAPFADKQAAKVQGPLANAEPFAAYIAIVDSKIRDQNFILTQDIFQYFDVDSEALQD